VSEERFGNHLDDILKEAAQKAHDDITVPPLSHESWFKVKQKLKTRSRRKLWVRRMKMVTLVAASMMLGAFLFGGPAGTNASTAIVKIVKQWQGRMLTMFYGEAATTSTGAKTPPPPDAESAAAFDGGSFGTSRSEKVSLEEAGHKTAFHLYVPETLPAGYTLDNVEVYWNGGAVEANTALIRYKDAGGRTFRIFQQMLMPNTMVSSSVNPAAGTVSDVTIRGKEASLVVFADGRTKLEWVVGGIWIQIIGDLNQDDILTVANSLK